MRTHCVHGGRGGVRAVAYVRIFFKYSANVFIFDKCHIIVGYKHICIKETIYKPCIILSGGGGGQKLANSCVRTLWMAPYCRRVDDMPRRRLNVQN